MRGARYGYRPLGAPRPSRRRTRLPFRHGASIAGIILALGSAVYGLFFTRVFLIDYVEVSAKGGIDASRIRAALFRQMDERRLFIPQKNLLAFDSRAAELRLRDAFVIERLSIAKTLPNKIRISVTGKPFRALWFSHGTLYDVTTRGTIAEPVSVANVSFFPASLFRSLSSVSSTAPKPPVSVSTPEQEELQVPIVVDEKNEEARDNESVLAKDVLNHVLALSDALRDSGVHYDYMKASRGSSDVRVVTNEGWEIVTTSRDDPTRQISMLSKVIREKIKSNRKKLQYVDVRFGNRVYYK